MTLKLGCIADDYTGASDLANTLTSAGLRTVQTIGVPDDALALPDVDAIVVALKSRSIAAADAVAKSQAADRWLRARGASHVLFKICSTFDSTDAGNIGPVMDALRNEAGDDVVLVTPAFPEAGRTVYQGHVFVGAVPLNESPLKDHPLNPMHDANIVRVLGRQSRTTIGLADRTVVAGGVERLRARIDALARDGVGAIIADAINASDLETIGKVARESKLSVGASGLGWGLARAIGGSAGAARGGGDVGGAIACLAGSCSQATLEQIARAEATMPVLKLDPERLIGGADALREALEWVRERLPHGPVLVASSASPDNVRAIQARHGRDAAGHAVEAAMADLAEGFVAAGVRRLIVAGGETSGSVVDRLRLPGFLIEEEIAPGVPVLLTVGREPGMRLALKSGNFGGPDFFARAVAQMR